MDAWEGKVNAWPLDEGPIDHVDRGYGGSSDENPWYTANVIASRQLQIAGATIDATVIDPALLQKLHEVGDVEANVATGYHAIEFLLWARISKGPTRVLANGPGPTTRSAVAPTSIVTAGGLT